MHTALEEPVREELQSIGHIDGNAPVQRSHPLPSTVISADLQGRNGLSEQKGEASKVSVALDPDIVELLIRCGISGVVLHVPKVTVRNGVIVAMKLGKVVLRHLKNDGEEGEELLDDVVVDVAGEVFDFRAVVVDNG